jgi:hypothetical protein
MPVTWEGIVKVQRSLFSTKPGTQVRINNQTHSVIWTGPIDPDLIDWFETDEHKFYAYAELRDTLIHIVRRVEPQAW